MKFHFSSARGEGRQKCGDETFIKRLYKFQQSFKRALREMARQKENKDEELKASLLEGGKAQDKSCFSTVPHGKPESETHPSEPSQATAA